MSGYIFFHQVYVGAASQAQDADASYKPWGHSSVVSPWGEVVSTCEDEEAIVYADLGECWPFVAASPDSTLLGWSKLLHFVACLDITYSSSQAASHYMSLCCL